MVVDWTKDTFPLQSFAPEQLKNNLTLVRIDIIATSAEEFRVYNDPCSHQVLPESRWETARVGVSSVGTVVDGSPTLASRAVLMGM